VFGRWKPSSIQPRLHHLGGSRAQLAQGVQDGVTVAGAELHQQVAVAAVGVEVVVGEGRHGAQPSRADPAEAVAPVEQGGAEGHGHGEAVGLEHRPEDAGVGRRRVRAARGRRLTHHQALGTAGDDLQRVGQAVAGLGEHVERGHQPGRRLRVDDAGLVRSDHRPGPRLLLGRAVRPAPALADADGIAGHSGRGGTAGHRPTGQEAAPAHPAGPAWARGRRRAALRPLGLCRPLWLRPGLHAAPPCPLRPSMAACLDHDKGPRTPSTARRAAGE
jgi:hypothetical protein